jgi:hypothetical protein
MKNKEKLEKIKTFLEEKRFKKINGPIKEFSYYVDPNYCECCHYANLKLTFYNSKENNYWCFVEHKNNDTEGFNVVKYGLLRFKKYINNILEETEKKI